jgi:fused signal recognition particle receptor
MISLFGKNEPEPTLLDKLKASVSKTKAALSETVDTIFLGERKIDPALLKQLETALLSADLGVRTTREILDAVREKMDRNALADAGQLKREIKSHIVRIIAASESAAASAAGPLAGVARASPNGKGPRVIFVVGVNGAGKTTSIGKLANRLRKDGLSVMLCAADTFRAAAVEQLEIWAQRNVIEVIKQKSGADPAAVVYDAVTAAKARAIDALIVDTAGAARRSVSAGRHDRTERAGASPRIHLDCAGDGYYLDKIGRHRERWHRRRYLARTRAAHSVRRNRRANQRPRAV